jgi:formylglycine-generating enzyme required for sulfatase activity
MNVFPGRFPEHDTGEDSYAGTSPVGAFAPNRHGIHNATDNVCEWCADRSVTRASDRSRYRCAARRANTPDSSAGNIGFRRAADLDPVMR